MSPSLAAPAAPTDTALDPRTPVVVAARRTPVTTAGTGGLATVEVADLAAPVLAALVADVRALGVGTAVDDVVLGDCTGPGGDVARLAALTAGLGVHVPGLTVDRQCGSGLAAVVLAAAAVRAGDAGLVLAGGAESASTSPRPARARFSPDSLGDPGMGEAAEALAAARGITRERQDDYAARSHRLAVAAQAAGSYDAELVPVAGVTTDDRPRPNLTTSVLRRFRPEFAEDGSVTAGNSCGVNDGAAAVAVVPESVRAAVGVPGLAVLATATAGVDPRLPGLGPVPAVRAVLDRAGVRLADVGAVEVVEAFASQVLACTDELGLDPLGDDDGRVCTQGGSIALGHPWGASGALVLVRLFARMVRADGPRFGVATCAVGGGQGVAVLVERVG